MTSTLCALAAAALSLPSPAFAGGGPRNPPVRHASVTFKNPTVDGQTFNYNFTDTHGNRIGNNNDLQQTYVPPGGSETVPFTGDANDVVLKDQRQIQGTPNNFNFAGNLSYTAAEALVGQPGNIRNDMPGALQDLGLDEITVPVAFFSEDQANTTVFATVDLTQFGLAGAPQFSDNQVFDIVNGTCSLLPGFLFSTSTTADSTLDPNVGLTVVDPLTDSDVMFQSEAEFAIVPDPISAAPALGALVVGLFALHRRHKQQS